VAIVTPDRTQTYEELARDVRAVASGLIRFGVTRGDHVALLLPNVLEHVHAFFAVARCGGVLVPVNTFLAEPEIATVLEDSRATTLLTTARRLSALAPLLPRLPRLRRVVIVPGEEGSAASLPASIAITTWSEMMAIPEASAPPEAPAESPAPRGRTGGDLAILTYTSGTTGRMKGVMLTNDNLLANARACLEAVKLHEGDRLLVFLPMFHSLTQMVCLVTPVLAALSVVLLPGVDKAAITRALKRHRPTIFLAVPAIYAAMAERRPGALVRWLNPVRLYICGGAPLPMDVQQRFEAAWGRPLCEGYGLSEASPVVSFNPVEGERRAGSVGRPLPGVEVKVLLESGAVAAAGEIGELAVRGPNVMAGYFERPEETAAAMKGEWLLTGDLARLDEDGYIYIVGRRKEMLIYRGMNVYPREVEEVLSAHPEVSEAAVVGIEDSGTGEVPHAAVSLRPGATATERDLRLWCRERLARYKVPRSIRLFASLPKNATGKILKSEIKETLAAAAPGETILPEDP
jgi:long-chain acyl-CoA synthetase